MSIYDSLLAQAAQAYQTTNQNAMTQAQMPTFADKFLAGLRGGQDQGYKQAMGMGQLQMNQTYKQSQEQQMVEHAKSQLLQRQTGLLNAASNDLTPYNRAGYVELGSQNGLPASIFPQQQFQSSPSSALDNSKPWEGAPFVTGENDIQTPVDGTGYGSRYQQRTDALDSKWDIANLGSNSKMLMLQYKGMEPKSALGKLNSDYARLKGTPAEISDQDYSAMRSKLETLVNPLAAPWLGQGYVASPTLNRPGTALPGNVQATPGVPNHTPSGGNLGGGTSPANTPNLPSQPKPYMPGPPTPKTAVTNAQEEGKTAGAITTIDNLIANLDKALVHPGIDSGAFIPGLGWKGRSLTPEGVAADQLLTSIRSGEVVNQIQALKANGAGLGRVTQMEWNGLGNMISSLDLSQDPKTLKQNIMQIKGVADKIKGNLQTSSANVEAARGMGGGNVSPEGTRVQMADGSFQVKRNGQWAPE